MLRFIKDLPPHVVGVHAAGEVSRDDYERVLIPRIEELARRQGEINYLLILETDVTNFSAAAWWEDFKLGLKHFSQWNRIAVATNQKGVEWFTDIFRFFIPGKAKGFSLDELDEAVKWVSEKDDDAKAMSKAQTPESDNDSIESSLESSSNKGQGPAGENL